MIIKPLITVNADPASREERLKALLAGAPATETETASPGRFSIDRFADRYVLNNLSEPFTSNHYTLELSHDLFDGGKYHSLPEWTSTPSLRSANGRTWGLLSCPDYFSIMFALEQHQNVSGQQAMIKEVKEFLNADFRLPRYLTTRSIVRYGAGQTPSGIVGKLKNRLPGIDAAIHDYGVPNAPERKEALVGPNCWVESGKGLEDGLYALTGTRDVAAIVRAAEFVTGVKPYWFRLNTTPSQNEERALVLGVDNDGRFNIDADVIGDGRPARGVAVRKKIST